MLPLFALPLGAWLVQTGTITLPTCGLKAAFNLPCLSCGATRATLNLLHGDLLTAIAYQPMIILIYVLLLGWGAVSTWALIKGHSINFDMTRAQTWAVRSLFVIIPIANWTYLVHAGI